MKFSELQVWQKSMDLVEKIYFLTRSLPEEEKFGLASQMRRAAVSIPSNIAEGYCRATTKEYIKFLYIAKGSNSELFTQLLICQRIDFFTREQINEVVLLSEEVGRILSAIILKLEEKS